MAELLHIRATARGERSFSLRAAEAFIEAYRAAHPDDTVTTIDVVADEIPEFGPRESTGKYRILSGEAPEGEEAEAWQVVLQTIEQFTAADKLVISSPIWNFGIPYRLKQYLDVIVQPGETFSFSPETGYTGLVTGRPAILFLARGGNYDDDATSSMDHQRPYLEQILAFMGFTEVETVTIEPTMAGGPEAADEALAGAIAAAEERAGDF